MQIARLNFLKFTLLLFLPLTSVAQNYNWITPNTDYIKVYIINDGMYRITKQDFTNLGINVTNIDPRTIKLFFKGNQLPIYFSGESDGVFNDTDYFDFYAQRNHGGLTNTYKEVNGQLIVDYQTNEFYDFYSDTAVYWIGWGGASGLRYSDYSFSTNITYPQDYHITSRHFEKDVLYSMGERLSPYDYRYFNTEKISGEGWYWRQLQRGNSISDTISIPFLHTAVDLCSLKVFAYPNSYNDTIPNEHILIIKVNNTPFDTLYRDNFNRFDTTIYVPVSLFNPTSQNQISFTYTNPYGYAGYLLFDNFELKFPIHFTFENNKLFFKSNLTDTSTKKIAVKGFEPQKKLYIYDVKNYHRIINIVSSNDTIYFSGKANGEYVIYNSDSLAKPLRIKKKQVPNLVSPTNIAEYLIVYNRTFENAAEQLRTFRATYDSLISFKAEIEDIYDIFNFGIENPVALRRFVKYVNDSWSPPKIRFLCLFGRGSINPKGIATNTYYINYVPVYGNPISDGYFVTTDLNSFLYAPQIAVGRIPAYSPAEAQNAVNKIIEYQTLQPDSWQKLFTFITGGFTRPDQIQFAIQSDNLINTYVSPPPLSGTSTRIYRNDSSGYITYNYQDSIKNSINRGTLLVNYIGHAASNNWDNGLEDPSILSNGNKCPLILSMTCFTGKTAEGERSFGENFFLLPNKGAIGFIGSSGWSFQGSGNTYNTYLIKGFALDSLRRIGELLKYAANSMKRDSLVSAVRNTINSYNLIGDPASKLIFPKHPEYDIQLTDYKLSNSYPTLRENITLNIYPKNLGTFADSCKIRFSLLRNNIISRYHDTVIRAWKYIDTISYTFSIDSLGQYSMKIILDVDNWNQREYKQNNSIIFPIFLKNTSFVPLKPFNSSIVTTDTVKFIGINPIITPGTGSVKVIMQLDTSKSFNSSALQTYYYSLHTPSLTTAFNINIPYKDSNIVYYWRLNSIINNTDTSGWSQIMNFIYKKVVPYTKTYHNRDSLVEVTKKFLGQFDDNQFYNTVYENGSIRLNYFKGSLIAQSWGGDYWEASFFRVNDKEYFLLDPILNWGGLNLAKVRKNDGVLTEVKHFKFTSPTSSDSVIGYLNTFTNNYILMLVKSVPNGVTEQMSSSLKNRLRSMGSYYADSVNLQSWQRWSFISYPTDTGYIKAEVFLSGGDFLPATSVLQPIFNYDSGYVSIILGPSSLWKELKWEFLTYPHSSLAANVLGITKTNQEILLFQNVQNGFIYGFDTLSTEVFPNVKVLLNFSLDTLSGYTSPLLKQISAKFKPPAELIPDPASFVSSDTVVQEGDTVRFSVRYYNIGFTENYSSIAKWSVNYYLGNKLFQIDTIRKTLEIDSSIQVSFLLNTSRLRNPTKLNDTLLVIFETNTGEGENELFTYNNNVVSKIIIKGDTTKPVMDITYDGIKVLNGDFIQRSPNIVLKFYDNGKMVIKDTSNIKIKLDGRYVPYYLNGVPNPELQLILPTNNLQATVIYKPNLTDGEHKFDYVSFDNSGNYADSVSHLLTVNPNLTIISLYNFPNPMKNYTTFVFNLAGGTIPNSCKLKIFTVAGRLIKNLDIQANIGINQVFWDGMDNDGDYIANGIYFYKLIVDADSKQKSSIQKLVVLK